MFVRRLCVAPFMGAQMIGMLSVMIWRVISIGIIVCVKSITGVDIVKICTIYIVW